MLPTIGSSISTGHLTTQQIINFIDVTMILRTFDEIWILYFLLWIYEITKWSLESPCVERFVELLPMILIPIVFKQSYYIINFEKKNETLIVCLSRLNALQFK